MSGFLFGVLALVGILAGMILACVAGIAVAGGVLWGVYLLLPPRAKEFVDEKVLLR